MLAKLGLALVLLVCAAVPLSQVNYNSLYNEMYPVNGLKRDVLGLCGATKATFVRALEEDRIGCYDSMPDKIDLAIGWVRTPDRVAAEKPLSAVQVAEKQLADAMARQGFGLSGQPIFTGYVTMPAAATAARPCEVAMLQPAAAAVRGNPLNESNEHLAQRIARGDDPALAALGLASHGAASASAAPPHGALPVLPLTGAGQRATAASSLDPTGRPGLSDSTAATGCGTRT